MWADLSKPALLEGPSDERGSKEMIAGLAVGYSGLAESNAGRVMGPEAEAGFACLQCSGAVVRTSQLLLFSELRSAAQLEVAAVAPLMLGMKVQTPSSVVSAEQRAAQVDRTDSAGLAAAVAVRTDSVVALRSIACFAPDLILSAYVAEIAAAAAAAVAAVAADAADVVAGADELERSLIGPCTVASTPNWRSPYLPRQCRRRPLVPYRVEHRLIGTPVTCSARSCVVPDVVILAGSSPPPAFACLLRTLPAANFASIHLRLARTRVRRVIGPWTKHWLRDRVLDWAGSWQPEVADLGGECSSFEEVCPAEEEERRSFPAERSRRLWM